VQVIEKKGTTKAPEINQLFSCSLDVVGSYWQKKWFFISTKIS